MTLNNAKIVKCPYCGAKKELMSLGSGNTFGAQYWSDLKVKAPMLPKISPVQKCAECGKYYLEYKQEASEGEKYSFEDGKLSYWEWKEAYGQLCEEEIDEEDLLNVRGWLVQSYNDFFHREEAKNTSSKDEYLFIKGVINELIKTIDWSETLDPLFPGGVSFGDPAQEKLVWSSKLSPVLKAELYREAGEFQKCKELLLSFQGKSMNTFDAQLCYGIKEQVEKGESAVFKFYDDREEEKKMSKEREAQKRFKKCPNGHYYKGDYCPYCPSSNAPEKQILDRVLKACHNLHAYDEELNKCPICGSSTVVDKFTSKNTDTALVMSIHLTNPVHVKVGELELFECNYIQVALPHCYKHGYFFTATQNYWNDEALEIEPDKKIVFGTITMTGKEFIRLCDLIYDNKLSVKNYSTIDVSPDDLIQLQELLKRVTRVPMKTPNADALEYGHNVFNNPTISDNGKPVFSVKVCPNGHGYDANQMACPFCGSDIVSEVIEERCGFTLVIADLSYEKDGVPILCQHAEVDGEMLSGDLCLRIEFTGAFKYAYYVSQKEGRGGLVVNPQSHIALSGDGFSDTFTGCEFYKMCDELFEKKESINQRDQDDTLINNEVENTCSEPELQKEPPVELKKNLNFKQCPNGHYYDSEKFNKCPYCEAKKDRNHEMCEDYGPAPTFGSKVCPNHHAYVDMDVCPYCGEKEVVGSVDMHTGEGYHIIARSAGQILKLVVDGEELSYYDIIIGYWVWDWASRIKSNYLIETGDGESIMIHCQSDIQFGNTHMNGKEFIKMCDAIIDNQLAIIGM